MNDLDEKKPRTHDEALPPTREKLVALFMASVALPDVQEIKVTPTSYSVTRLVADGEDVLPKSSADSVDAEFLIQHTEHEELDPEPDLHPYLLLEKAMRRLTERGLVPVCLLVPQGGLFPAFFALPDHDRLDHFMGVRVVYFDDEEMTKIVVVGGRNPYFAEASLGIFIDMVA